MEIRLHIPASSPLEQGAALEHALEVLTEANADWFKKNPEAPCCPACAGVVYYEPPLGQCQHLWGAPDVLEQGRATCATAAAYEAGAARAKGKPAHVAIEDNGGGNFHAVAYVEGKRIDSAAELEGYPNRQTPRCELEAQGFAVGGCGGCPSCAAGCPHCGGQGCPQCGWKVGANGSALEPGENGWAVGAPWVPALYLATTALQNKIENGARARARSLVTGRRRPGSAARQAVQRWERQAPDRGKITPGHVPGGGPWPPQLPGGGSRPPGPGGPWQPPAPSGTPPGWIPPRITFP